MERRKIPPARPEGLKTDRVIPVISRKRAEQKGRIFMIRNYSKPIIPTLAKGGKGGFSMKRNVTASMSLTGTPNFRRSLFAKTTAIERGQAGRACVFSAGYFNQYQPCYNDDRFA